MPILDGDVTIKSGRLALVYTGDPDVVVPASLASCGWVPQADAVQVGATADVVTVQALSPEQAARYRNVYRREGVGSATLEALRMGIVEARYMSAGGKRTTGRGASAQVYVDALVQQHATVGDLLSEVILRLTRGQAVETGYPFARQMLGYEAPVAEEEDADGDGAGFPCGGS